MLKKKNIYVILVSVLIIFLVILSSFLGLIIHIQWRQLNLAYRYYDTMEEFDTISYAKNVELDSLKIRLEFKELAVVEGWLRNRGKRDIASIGIRIKLLDIADVPVYTSMIYPLEPFQPPRFLKRLRLPHFPFLTGSFIKPNEVILFKSALWQCPRKFIKMLKKKSLKVSAEVARISLKPI